MGVFVFLFFTRFGKVTLEYWVCSYRRPGVNLHGIIPICGGNNPLRTKKLNCLSYTSDCPTNDLRKTMP
jgi:hypothetical protein